MTESHTQEVEKIFATDGTGGLRYLQDLLREDAPIHVPSALPFGDLYGFAGISEVVDDLLRRCDGAFKMEIVTSIGAGDLATIINKAEAQRNGESISYHNQWTFRFVENEIAEVWLVPSVPASEILRFYGFSR